MGSRVVKQSKLTTIAMVNGNEKKYKKVIDTDGLVKEWVGIGWITLDEKPDKRKHYLVVEE